MRWLLTVRLLSTGRRASSTSAPRGAPTGDLSPRRLKPGTGLVSVAGSSGGRTSC